MSKTIKQVLAAIDYIESHLQEKLDLATIASNVHYSKYYLHRMFTDAVDMTMQMYIQRRRLTEAARLLVNSEQPILQIAFMAGYESQQAFSDCFKTMYKKTPHQYRTDRDFYPLQLPYRLQESPPNFQKGRSWRQQIIPATTAHIPAWMQLVTLVIDGFPHLYEQDYLEQLQDAIQERRTWILKDADLTVGVMAFHRLTGYIDFLGVHPQYRRQGIAEAFCQKALQELTCSSAISITTFREGDKADPGYRKALKNMGFTEAELLVEFGYPTQRFILQTGQAEGKSHA